MRFLSSRFGAPSQGYKSSSLRFPRLSYFLVFNANRDPSVKMPSKSGTCMSEIWEQQISVFLMFFLSFNVFQKLPSGNPLTVVLFGKTGNGKSATGNSILGFDHFIDSPSSSSVTIKCDACKREEEREVTVIDTPGIMDTASVSAMEKAKEKVRFLTGFYNENQKSILRELAKVFVMSPYGLDAIIITIKYGCKFGPEDAEALRIFQRFFGIEALPYMILILTHGDEAAFQARKRERSIEEQLESYINDLPGWVQQFVKEIGERRMLFNNKLDPQINPDECTKQVSKLLQVKVHFESKI